jgi:hypothetical protein
MFIKPEVKTQKCRRCKITYIVNPTSERYHKERKCMRFVGRYVDETGTAHEK